MPTRLTERPCQFQDYVTPSGAHVPSVCTFYDPTRCCGRPARAKARNAYWVCAEHLDLIEARTGQVPYPAAR